MSLRPRARNRCWYAMFAILLTLTSFAGGLIALRSSRSRGQRSDLGVPIARLTMTAPSPGPVLVNTPITPTTAAPRTMPAVAPTVDVAEPTSTAVGRPDTPADVASGTSPTALPSRVLIEHIPRESQERALSCELQSASDLAWFYGLPYTWDEIFMHVGHDPGGNPHKGFVGDSIDDNAGGVYPHGYGVYAEPIAHALAEIGLPARVHYAEPAEWLRQQIADERPVMVWAVAAMRQEELVDYVAADGTQIRAVRYEHTFLVIGYDPENVWVSDPWDGKVYSYSWDRFLDSWSLFDRMCVVIEEG